MAYAYPCRQLHSSLTLLRELPSDHVTSFRDWRASQQEEIAARDERSKKARANTIAGAESSIDTFYEEHAKKKERNIRENKDAEEEYLATLSSALTQGTTWERIASLVELENSQSKTIARAGPGMLLLIS